MTVKKIEHMTPAMFNKLSYPEQVEFLETCKADFLIINDLIKDRNEFRKGYYMLYNEITRLTGKEPETTFYLKGLKENV